MASGVGIGAAKENKIAQSALAVHFSSATDEWETPRALF